MAEGEYVNCDVDGGESEGWCEPDGAGVCLYVWWPFIILPDRLASLLLSDLILGHFSCGAVTHSLVHIATVCMLVCVCSTI